jgi:hypothetical protein
MKRRYLGKAIFMVGCCLLATGFASRADTLDVTLTDATQSVVQGTTEVEFDATVSNSSTSAETIFLNGDSSTTSSSLVSVDDTPFLNNAPFSLDPGTSSGPFAIFDVALDPSLGPGEYTGSFSILGGSDGGSFDDVGDASFTVDVTSPVAAPEPSTLLLVGTGLVSLVFLRRKFRLSR